MLLTEQILNLSRNASPDRRGVYSYVVPYGLRFSDPAQVFGQDWTEVPDPSFHEDVRQALKIVVVLAFTKYLPRLRLTRPWWAIEHQCGGHACEQLAMVATRIHLRDGIGKPLLKIARDGYYAEHGHFYKGNVLASHIARYVAALNQIGLDCEASWGHLTESVYPIDATQENLDALSDDPPDLRHLVDWGGSPPARYSDDPVILILTQNSD